MLVVRHGGRAAFVPVTRRGGAATRCGEPRPDDWWHTFATDRYEYRTTDTINAWGIVRDRDDGRCPTRRVTLTLRATSWTTGSAPIAAIATAHAGRERRVHSPRSRSTDLPLGDYRLHLAVGDASLGETWMRIRTIVKPAYRLAVTTDRHAVILGESLTEPSSASFFEGTPVAGTELHPWAAATGGAADGPHRRPGRATGVVRVRPVDEDEDEASSGRSATSAPDRRSPRRRRSAVSTPVAVFRASGGRGRRRARSTGRGSRVTGTVSDVAFDRFEARRADLWQVDPRGDAARGRDRAGHGRRGDHDPCAGPGTRYDFITKQVVPTYDYGTTAGDHPRGPSPTGADGTFRLAIDRHRRRPELRRHRHLHRRGRTRHDRRHWRGRRPRRRGTEGTWLEAAGRPASPTARTPSATTVLVRFRGGGGDVAGSRYLYAISQRGLRYATMARRPTLRTTFKATVGAPASRSSASGSTAPGYEAVVDRVLAQLRVDDRPPAHGRAHAGPRPLRAGRHRDGHDPDARRGGRARRRDASSSVPSTRSCTRWAPPTRWTRSTSCTRTSARGSRAGHRPTATPCRRHPVGQGRHDRRRRRRGPRASSATGSSPSSCRRAPTGAGTRRRRRCPTT